MPTSWLALHLTERCGLRCRHCLRDPGRRPADLAAGLAARVMGEAVALHGIECVGFTGGEPLLYPDLEAVLDAAVGLGLRWHVVTSGASIDRLLAALAADARRRAALRLVVLSLDGADAAVHDRVRGEGSYRDVMAAALALRARELPFQLQMTVHAGNAHQVDALAVEAAKLGAERVSFGMAMASGAASDPALWLPLEEWASLRDRVGRLAEILAIPVIATEGFPRRQRFHVCEPWRSDVLHVDPRGRLTVCCQLSGAPGGDEDVVADLASTSLQEAHALLLERVHELQRRRLEAASRTDLGPWEAVQCNWCAQRHGRPYWVEGGSAGPRARRDGGRA
jgi:MoaA/NifB/PqqE/SkfB family radical SAM enzyme